MRCLLTAEAAEKPRLVRNLDESTACNIGGGTMNERFFINRLINRKLRKIIPGVGYYQITASVWGGLPASFYS